MSQKCRILFDAKMIYDNIYDSANKLPLFAKKKGKKG